MAVLKCEKCGKEYVDIIGDDLDHLNRSNICRDCTEKINKGLVSENRDPNLLVRCEQHLRVIKGILIAGAAYLIVKELIVLLIALSK